jgi:hypothetical protein
LHASAKKVSPFLSFALHQGINGRRTNPLLLHLYAPNYVKTQGKPSEEAVQISLTCFFESSLQNNDIGVSW